MTNRFDYKGMNAKAPYFEGWYVKISDEKQDFTLSLIPGVALFSENECFVQYNLYHKGKTMSGKITFPVQDFDVIEEPYTILMPLFVLSEEGVKAHLTDDTADILIDLTFGEFLPLKQSVYSPSIMGPLEYLNVPCYHDIVSMRHEVRGKVIINDEKINLDKGSGYLEKDRGSSFPSQYVWMQCSGFNESRESSLFLSVAEVPLSVFRAKGAIAVFHDGRTEYRFATYLGTRAEVTMDDDRAGYTVKLTDRTKSLTAEVSLKDAAALIAPTDSGMDHTIKETVKAEVKVTFKEKNKAPLYLTSKHGAAEAVNWI